MARNDSRLDRLSDMLSGQALAQLTPSFNAVLTVAEIFVSKPRDQRVFVKFEIITNVLFRSFRFI